MLYLIVIVLLRMCQTFDIIFDMYILDGNEKWCNKVLSAEALVHGI